PPRPRSRCCTCKRCCCWMLFSVILVILILGILAAVVYFVFKPKVPDYSLDAIKITQFKLGSDDTLSTTFDVNLTATNPNKRIGIYYRSGSDLRVLYSGTQLCQGSLPEFYQGHRNTTQLSLNLSGETADGLGLLQSLRTQQQQTGSVPLDLRGRVPVRLKLGSLKLTTWKFLVRCRVTVDSLSADNTIRIRESSCSFRFRL
ncbi:hypothetical protein M569_04680, partial [Genlisea aurea]